MAYSELVIHSPTRFHDPFSRTADVAVKLRFNILTFRTSIPVFLLTALRKPATRFSTKAGSNIEFGFLHLPYGLQTLSGPKF